MLWVVPVHLDSYDFVMQQRKQQYEDLKHGLGILGITFDESTKPNFFVVLWLLDSGKLKLDWRCQMEEERYKSLTHISNSVMNMFESDVDIYWLSRGIFQYVDKFRGDISKLVQFTKSILEKEDNELYSFLLHIDAFTVLPINNWMQSCFANVITESSVGKIWDKLAAGSCKILVFVAVVLLMTLRRRILKCNTVAEVLECVNRISDEVADVIVSKAIEMWQQNGSSLASTNGLEFTKSPASTVWL
ncbi:TBC1 domain family member 7 isoform X2 [Bacillus rossius redtenbacheri]|uniref:TBC1 domain family member 7 isoform X2 n=1 Tax=Bacillus rossius redtenbacheri TaxID=93214 RepID=UPI002FDCDE80